GDGIREPPPGYRIGFRQAADRHSSIGHARQGRNRNVACTIVDNVFVDFVRDRQRVVAATQPGYRLEFCAREDLAAGIVGSVDDYGLGVWTKRLFQLAPIDRTPPLPQRDVPTLPSAP